MLDGSDIDLLTRSLRGDSRSRVELYRKFFQQNATLQRIGSRYSSPEDFLHDSFTNLLRTGHSFGEHERMSDRVEHVATWTALERERLRGADLNGGITVRLCAAMEADLPNGRLASYVPPRAGVNDSLSSRLSGTIGEAQFALLQACARENCGWEEAASAAGKPVQTLGLVLIRAADRLSRFFGAPPPLNEDLRNVFAGHPNGAPTGRVISMRLDSTFYSATPEMRKIGLSIPIEVRTLTLWNAARSSTPPDGALADHLAKCNYCADVLRSLLLLQRALLSGPGADFLLCPGASILTEDADEPPDSFTRHLAGCPACRDERDKALDLAEPPPEVATVSVARSRNLAWGVAAAVLLLALVLGYRYYTSKKQEASALSTSTSSEASQIKPNSKYSDLVQPVAMDDPKLITSVFPQDQFLFMEALRYLRLGDRVGAKMIFENMVNREKDPAARMLYAICLYGESSTGEGYAELKKAEAMPPRNAYRCWATLQSALRMGDKETAEREIEHLSSDPDFGARAKNIQARMRTRN